MRNKSLTIINKSNPCENFACYCNRCYNNGYVALKGFLPGVKKSSW